MILKPGVKFIGIRPECGFAMCVVDSVHQGLFGRDATITSIRDDSHNVTGGHPDGSAFDVRSHGLNEGEKTRFRIEAEIQLGPEWLVELHYSGTDNEHFHIQIRKAIRATLVRR
jgi:hypothetical protein